MTDDTVTVRDRDSREQYRIAAAACVEVITKKMKDARS